MPKQIQYNERDTEKVIDLYRICLSNIESVSQIYRDWTYVFIIYTSYFILSHRIFLNFQHASRDVEKMILGNNCDMDDKRQVSKERGEQLAIEHGIKFMEISAKANINIEEAFLTLARDIKAKMDRKMVCLMYLNV